MLRGGHRAATQLSPFRYALLISGARLLVLALLRASSAISWRDPESAATPLLIGRAWRLYLQTLEQLAEPHNRQALLLPFHRDQDGGLLAVLQASGWMGQRLQARNPAVQAGHPQEALALFQSAGLVLAMRLHALILAGLSCAPLAALSDDPKVRACAAGLACPCQDLDQPGGVQPSSAPGLEFATIPCRRRRSTGSVWDPPCIATCWSGCGAEPAAHRLWLL